MRHRVGLFLAIILIASFGRTEGASFVACIQTLRALDALLAPPEGDIERLDLAGLDFHAKELLNHTSAARGTHWPRLTQVEDEAMMIALSVAKLPQKLMKESRVDDPRIEKGRAVVETLIQSVEKIEAVRASSFEWAKTELIDPNEKRKMTAYWILNAAMTKPLFTERAQKFFFEMMRGTYGVEPQSLALKFFESQWIDFSRPNDFENLKVRQTALIFGEARKNFAEQLIEAAKKSLTSIHIELKTHYPRLAKRLLSASGEFKVARPQLSEVEAKVFLKAYKISSSAYSVIRNKSAGDFAAWISQNLIEDLVSKYPDVETVFKRAGPIRLCPNYGELLQGDFISEKDAVDRLRLASFVFAEVKAVAAEPLRSFDPDSFERRELNREIRRARAMLTIYELLLREEKEKAKQ
jgi:hypothetical protein